MSHSTEKAFSFVEVLVILCVLAAIITWAGLEFERGLSENLVRRTARSLDALLSHKSLQSISRGENIYLFVDEESGELRELESLPQSDAEVELARVVFKLPKNLRFDTIRLPRLSSQLPSLLFSAEGFASPGTLSISDHTGEKLCSLVQALGGRRTIHCSDGGP